MIRNTILTAAVALLSAAVTANPVRADEAKAAAALNAPLAAVTEANKSWKPVMQAYANLTAPPASIGDNFNLLSVWPGMEDWAAVKEWAAANPEMAKALRASEKAFVFGMPYGRANVPPELAEKGIFIAIGDGENQFVTNPSYLKAWERIGAYVAAEMYRLGEEKKFDEAMSLGLASLRLMRQVADQQLLEEKRYALEGISRLCSMQRDFFYTFLNDIPAATLKQYALDGYPFVRPSDRERLHRLEMPEGDRIVAEAALEDMFDARGQPDRSKFAAILPPIQAKNEPLSYFGAARRWESIAEVHGSLDATRAKLTSIYDDWWRRWRVRYFDTLLDNPTALSKTNRVRYAMVILLAKDLESIFALRKRANAELNGLVLTCGLCAWHRDLGTWPRSLDQSYSQFVRKRFDYDPFDPQYGRWQYDLLSAPKTVDSQEFGRVELTGALLYAMGYDKENSGGVAATDDGLSGDFIAWPPLRAVARQQAAKP